MSKVTKSDAFENAHGLLDFIGGMEEVPKDGFAKALFKGPVAKYSDGLMSCPVAIVDKLVADGKAAEDISFFSSFFSYVGSFACFLFGI